ncbi:oligosaccharide flippase family protein [Pasteurellaceae bacterium HPA106]|uniref:oligosaccharide flippase family protein n=1 Tax=Spirabiliibacterium pneumoniae TaxID=221400 RepID=UPI001AAD64BE|nr:oligosaccharide flippase family protein [Spirabiliibacterium pneumoniae]MBE2895835.1 oligosaccharide flippase family protein [Spirabiliibacterium pneumoniae]
MNEYKKLFSNFSSLYLLKIGNIIVPIIIFPYLVRVIGVEKFGLISFSQFFASFFMIFVSFGFELSIVKLISGKSENTKKISKIFSITIFMQFILLIICLLIYVLVIFSFDKFKGSEAFYIMTFLYVAAQALMPVWFFLAMQEMKFITIINLIAKFLTLLLIILLIKEEKDYEIYPIIMFFSYFIMLPISFTLIAKKFHIVFNFPSFELCKLYFTYCFQFFLSRISLKIYEISGLLLVGFLFDDRITGHYAIADKLRNAINSLYSPLSQAIYPYMIKSKNINFYKKFFRIIISLTILGCIILFFYTEYILAILFGTNAVTQETLYLVRIFSIIILFDVPSIFLGYPLLGAFGYYKYVNYSLVYTCLLYLILVSMLYLLNIISIYSLAYCYLATIIFEMSIRLFGTIKHKIWYYDNF